MMIIWDLFVEFCIQNRIIYCDKYSFVDIHIYIDKGKEFNRSIIYFIFIPNTNQYLTQKITDKTTRKDSFLFFSFFFAIYH